MVNIKKLILSVLLSTLVSCSSDYVPSENMLVIKQSMTTEQAVNILQTQIWENNPSYGICGSRGFWYDDESDIQVSEDKITLLAHKRGKQIKKLSHSFNDVVVFEKQYFYYDFVFNNVKKIIIYKDARSLPVFVGCNKHEVTEEYLIIDLFADKLNNLKFIVLKKDLDTTMAAIVVLMPERLLTVN